MPSAHPAHKCRSADLIQASKYAAVPAFLYTWQTDKSHFRYRAETQLSGWKDNSPGRGFFVTMSDVLPAKCLALLIRLATIDRVIAAYDPRVESAAQTKVMYSTMNALQYDLLNLPPWHDLDRIDQASSDQALYDICKLTAIIYSNGVLFGLPAQSGWHTRLSQSLRDLFDTSSLANWPEAKTDFSIWCLCVGALAAFRSPDRDFYECALREVLQRKKLTVWVRIEAILADFMWSHAACRHGAAVLWQAVR
jgi:hypothetical protein